MHLCMGSNIVRQDSKSLWSKPWWCKIIGLCWVRIDKWDLGHLSIVVKCGGWWRRGRVWASERKSGIDQFVIGGQVS